jgi:2-methylcitrate dehydratase PrpD
MSDAFDHIFDFARELTADRLPAPVMHQARRCLVDLLGVWAAGAATRPARIARDHAARRYGAAAQSVAMLFDGRAVSPPGFAFAGAIAIDAVDGHDGHEICKGHCGVALLPALLAELGPAPGLAVEDFLTHLAVGYEIALRAGLSLHATVADYHSSGAWSALGCAGMLGRIRGFSDDRLRHALGIAEYYGPRAQMMRSIDHPSMVKDSSGWGAMVGVSAADLAEDGFTGAPAITCEDPGVAAYWSDLGRRWRMLEMNFKAYPVCRWAQPPIEAIFSLRERHAFRPEDISRIEVLTFHEATRLAVTRPRDSDEAQYSLPVSVALSLFHGALLPRHLEPEAFNRPEVLALADRVSFSEVDAFNAVFPAERYAVVRLTFADGRALASEPHVARGNFDAPLSDAEILGKFGAYAEGVLSRSQIQAISAILDDPDRTGSIGDSLAGLTDARA